MWNRAELKRNGRIAFRSNYWNSVAAGIVLSLAAGGIAFNSVSISDAQLELLLENATAVMIVQLLRAASTGLVLTLIASIFLLNPLNVGARRFFIVNGKSPAKLKECIYAFRNSYWNVTFTMFLREIYLFLWYCLFFIPGIIKSYSYRMVPYILAEHPDMPANQVIRMSREMMRGQKWKTFVLDLSFLGWNILGAFTFGIVTYLYVRPYVGAADAELYRVLRGPEYETGTGSGPSDDGFYDEPDPHDEEPYNRYYD